MNKTPKIGFRLITISVIIAALIISASLFASSATSKQTVTTTAITTTATTATTTVTPSAEIEPNGSLLLSKTWDSWVFTVSINSTFVRVGGEILFSGTLTYLGSANTTIDEVEPIDGVSVYNSTGGLVWAYEPGEVTVKATITPGETLGGENICIPIMTAPLTPTTQNQSCEFAFRQQPQPGVYSIQAEPNIYSYPANQYLGNNLQINATFTIFSGTHD